MPKHFGLRLRANSKKQRFARDRGQVQRLSCCRTELPLAKSLPFTDKSMKMDTLSVNPHHNGQKFTDKSLKNGGLSVKCVLLTDKSAKIGSLSVKFERNPGAPPKIRKNSRHHGTNFHHYSVAYGLMSVRLHTFIIGFRPATRLMISSCRVVTALALITRAPPYLPPC